MISNFNTQHWLRVEQARAAQGLNRLLPDAKLRPHHVLMNKTLHSRFTGEDWVVTSVSEEWLRGSYFEATLEHGSSIQRCVAGLLTSTASEIRQQWLAFQDEFELPVH